MKIRIKRLLLCLMLAVLTCQTLLVQIAATTEEVFSAEITKVQGDQITINKGTEDGLKINTVLDIIAVTGQVNSPITGQAIKTFTKPVGKIKLTYLETTASIGKLISLKPRYKVDPGMTVQISGPWKVKALYENSSLESYMTADIRLSHYLLSLGNLDIQNRLATVLGQVTYLRATLEGKPQSMYGGAIGAGPLWYGGGFAGFNVFASIGGIDSGLNGQSDLNFAFVSSPKADIANPDLKDILITAKERGYFYSSSSLNITMTADIYYAKKNYGGLYNGGPKLHDSGLNLDLYTFSVSELRIPVRLGVNVKVISALTVGAGAGMCFYSGNYIYEYIDPNTSVLASAEEPRSFQTIFTVGGLVLNLTDKIAVGALAEIELATKNNPDGSVPAPTASVKVSVGFRL